ncbi:MAG TPA: helix-turn-helix domain-containing protein [Accumulibacter sp.]|nr:hypothetical protein [Hyphomonas sp.]HRI92717.1 helix-turn-helix domain-containing protein [Accumulibacter sp.]
MSASIQVNLVTLGEQIRRIRLHRGFSQVALAGHLGVAKQTVSQWESGKSPPLVTNILRFCALTDVPPEILFHPIAIDTGDLPGIEARMSASNRVVPLLTPDQVLQSQNRPATDAHRDWIATNRQHARNAFALRVADPSMQPTFRPDDFVVIDHVQLLPGAMILVRSGGQVKLRAFRPADAELRTGTLIAVNKNWPGEPYNENTEYLGSVVEHIRLGQVFLEA